MQWRFRDKSLLGRSIHRNALPSRDRSPAIGTFAIHKATRRTSDTHTAFPDAAHEVFVQHRTCSGQISLHARALSRAPLRETIDRGSEEFQREENFYVNAILVQLPASDRRREEIRREVAKDDTLAIESQYVKHGWPDDKRRVHGPVNQYWPERGNLSIHDGLLLRGTRLVVPPSLRCDILRYLHVT